MKNKNLLQLILCVALVICLSSCLTTGLPAPKSSSDTLTVVPVIIIDARKSTFKGEVKYIVYMDNIDTGNTEKFTLSTKDHGYKYFKGIPAGKYSIIEYGTEGMNNDQKYDINISKYFVVEEGKINIFPGKLTVYIYDDEISLYDSSYLYYDINEMGDNQILRIKKAIKTEENYSLWK